MNTLKDFKYFNLFSLIGRNIYWVNDTSKDIMTSFTPILHIFSFSWKNSNPYYIFINQNNPIKNLIILRKILLLLCSCYYFVIFHSCLLQNAGDNHHKIEKKKGFVNIFEHMIVFSVAKIEYACKNITE